MFLLLTESHTRESPWQAVGIECGLLVEGGWLAVGFATAARAVQVAKATIMMAKSRTDMFSGSKCVGLGMSCFLALPVERGSPGARVWEGSLPAARALASLRALEAESVRALIAALQGP